MDLTAEFSGITMLPSHQLASSGSFSSAAASSPLHAVSGSNANGSGSSGPQSFDSLFIDEDEEIGVNDGDEDIDDFDDGTYVLYVLMSYRGRNEVVQRSYLLAL